MGRNNAEEKKVIKDLVSVEKAGSFAVVLESVTENLAKKINKISKIPVIGIGASKNCDGQILVFDDLIGLSGFYPRFVKKYIREKSKLIRKKLCFV